MKLLKHLILLLAMAPAFANATDIFVNQFGTGGAYSTISAAITAATAGDRIIILPKSGGAAYNENLSITKPLELLSATNAVQWTLNGNVTFSGALTAGATYSIIDMENLVGSITCSTGPASGTRANVNVLNCTLLSGSVSITANYTISTLANCDITGNVTGRFMNLYGNTITLTKTNTGTNTTSTVTIDTEIASNDSIYIIGNRIICNITSNAQANGASTFNWTNNSQYGVIMNNFISFTQSTGYGPSGTPAALMFANSKTGGGSNTIVNNSCYVALYGVTSGIQVSSSAPSGVYNNVVVSGSTLTNGYNVSGGSGSGASYNFWGGGAIGTPFTGTPNDGTNTTGGSISLSTGASSVNNTGFPDPIFTDLDLSRNDVGTYGGSFSQANYFSNTGSSRVYIVKSPRSILQGGQLNFNASGYDR